MSNQTQSGLINADVALPDEFKDSSGNLDQAEAYKLWTIISANDEVGITISNVKEGDEIVINSSSGIASFKESSMKLLKAGIGLANAIGNVAVLYATEGAAEPFLGSWNSFVDEATDTIGDTVKHARRDSYGRDPGTGDYAKDEGGLIVCMPKAKGAVYATDDYHLEGGAKHHGRKEEYYPSRVKEDKNVFYPCNVDGGLMSQVASEAGTVNILAFDEKFSDNAGAYTTEIYILRKHRPSGRSNEELIATLNATLPTM